MGRVVSGKSCDVPQMQIKSSGRPERTPMRLLFTSLLLFSPVFSQLSPSAEWATHAANQYQAFPNLTYLTAGGQELKLDIYQRRGATTPQPTVIFFHGGF